MLTEPQQITLYCYPFVIKMMISIHCNCPQEIFLKSAKKRLNWEQRLRTDQPKAVNNVNKRYKDWIITIIPIPVAFESHVLRL